MSYHVESHLQRLIHSLENNIPIRGYGKGLFGEVTWHQSFYSKQSHIISIGKTFCKAIDQIEKSYRIVEDSDWIKAGNLIITKLRSHQSEDIIKIERLVQQRMCGLKYRSGRGKESSLSDEERLALLKMAMTWKESQKHFDITSWQGKDQEMINELGQRYPTFSKLILCDDLLCNRFLNWTIRDNMSISSFVEFPKTGEFFDKIKVSPGFSMAGPRKLQVTVLRNIEGRPFKFLSYPVYAKHNGKLCSKHVKVWDKDQEFEFPLGFRATLRDIYKAMRIKNKYWVDFIISENGFENWNPAEWGLKDERGIVRPIKLEKNEWFKHVPITERLTLEEAKERYGKELNGKNYGVCLRAARKRLDLDINRAHSFLEICIPDDKGGYYTLFPGKFTRVLPTSFFNLLTLLGDTLDGVVVSHDLNSLHPWRQQTRYSEVVSEKEFLWIAEKIRFSILEAKKGNFVFSALADSCSTWSQDMMNDLLEKLGKERQNFFTMSLLDSKPKGLLGFMIYVSQFLPKWLQKLFLRLTILFFFPWRSKTVYDSDGNPHKISALGSSSWDNLTFDNPAYLFHRQIHEKKLLPSGKQPEWLS